MQENESLPLPDLLASLGVSVESTGHHAQIRDKWLNVTSTVTVTRAEHVGSVTTEFHQGIACIDWKRAARALGFERFTYPRFRPAETDVADVLRAARRCYSPPTVADVLHSLVLDASACDQSFEDWAGDFGYDTDSRKALETYLLCQELGGKVRRLFNAAEWEALTLAAQEY